MKIRRALKSEARLLSDLALRSKAHWGYAEDVLEQWRTELTISPHEISAHPTFVATIDEDVAGFYSLLPSAGPWAMNHFWVSPECMQRGVGRCLLAHALAIARARGASKVDIDADPNAEGFYVRCGAFRTGEVSAPIPGQPARVRPLLVIHTVVRLAKN